jgi:hypothetical protein
VPGCSRTPYLPLFTSGQTLITLTLEILSTVYLYYYSSLAFSNLKVSFFFSNLNLQITISVMCRESKLNTFTSHTRNLNIISLKHHSVTDAKKKYILCSVWSIRNLKVLRITSFMRECIHTMRGYPYVNFSEAFLGFVFS